MLDIDIHEVLTVNLPAYCLLTIVNYKIVNMCVNVLSVFMGSGHEINI